MQNRILHIFLLLVCMLASSAVQAHKRVPNIQKIQTGAKLVFPVLLVEFEDVKFSVHEPKASFSNMLNKTGYNRNGATGSVAEYLGANFNGHASFAFLVSEVITLPYPISRYGAAGTTSNDTDVRRMVHDACIAAMDSSFNFSGCTVGEDGIIGNISIIYAGHSEAEGAPSDAIWPHQMNMEGSPVTVGEYRITSYTCTAELRGAEGDTIAPIGPFCHEFAHFLGLPDLYDTNGENEGKSPALYGTLSIMDNGHYLNRGNTPPYFNAIEREILGIADMEELLPDSTYTLKPIHESGKVYRISSTEEGEYFLLEYRKKHKWDSHIGGEGLIVYHIDKSEKQYAGLASRDRWIYNNINSYSSHECARVLAAAGAGCSIDGVFFPGSSNTDELLSFRGNTRLQDWNGYAVGIGLRNITLKNGVLEFKSIRDYSFNDTLPQAVDCRVLPYQKDAKVEWRGIETSGSKVRNTLKWLVSWEDGKSGERRSIATDTSCCHIGELVPGTSYTLEVRALNGREFGEPHTLTFRTHNITSPYPYIFVPKEGVEAGGSLDLRIFNLPEDATYTDWYVNGHKLQQPQIKIEKKGEIEIIAGIGYKDGTYEKITKILSIL